MALCRSSGTIARLCGLAVALACSESRAPSADSGAVRASPAGPSGARIAAAAPASDSGQWTFPAKDYANSRYSELSQITAENAKGLKVAWTFSTGVLRGHEGAPLVVDNTMYFTTPFPNVAYALDLTRPGNPLKWKYRPNTAQASIGIACCDVVNRGASFAKGRIVYNLLDGHTVALDAASGKQLWKTRLGDINRGETMTMAPLIVHDKVFVGNSGGEMGVRGWIAALDLATGRELWRAYSTGPDRDVKIGARFKPYYAADRGTDLGATSWPGDTWKMGGGAVWGWLSYDPELNLLYHGTSNPGPWNGAQRPGDNKWTCAILARDPDTGEVVWAYQITPHDMWDYDGVNENILADLPIGGRIRKTLVHFDRNGYAYTLDRATGEVLVAKPFVPMNWSSGFDLGTGRAAVVAAKAVKQGVTVKDICPSLEGGKDEQPAAFSPRTGLFYVPTNNLCMDFTTREVAYIAGTPFVGADAPEKAGPGGYRGELMAWDATTGTKSWGIREPFPVWSGVLATAGNVAFYGTLDGWVKAVDARSGQELWKFHTGSGIIGNVMSYLGPDGKQYVAVLSGIGGDMGFLIAGDVAANLPYDVRQRGTVLPDLGKYTSWGGTLYVFSL
ncbi:MAG: PQQ-dependent dehydrogenase, methanol/ethanol family [Gemmatimonadota bacterium]|nr:PQQ-dependent dehydrogenase, methanol/ethanol family [Gemmatimonadota bacterium]